MTLVNAIAIYLVIWWVVLFAVLPWGVRTQFEDGEVVPGSAESAPTKPRLARVAIATTLVSAVVFAVTYYILVHSGLTLDDIPIGPR